MDGTHLIDRKPKNISRAVVDADLMKPDIGLIASGMSTDMADIHRENLRKQIEMEKAVAAMGLLGGRSTGRSTARSTARGGTARSSARGTARSRGSPVRMSESSIACRSIYSSGAVSRGVGLYRA